MITVLRTHRHRDDRNRHEPFNFQIEEVLGGCFAHSAERKRLTVSYDDRLPDGGIVTRIASLEDGDSFFLHRYNDKNEIFEAMYTYHADRSEGDMLQTMS